jgi:diguanylate cyclase (GGDEF)-like protein
MSSSRRWYRLPMWQRVALLTGLVMLGLLSERCVARGDVLPGGPSGSVLLWDSQAEFLFDRAGLNFDQIRSQRFAPISSAPIVGATAVSPVVVWARLRVLPGWYVSVAREADEADLYVRVRGSYQHTRFGMLVPYADRPIQRLEPTAAIAADADTGSWMYLRFVMTFDRELVRFSTPAYLESADATTRADVVYPLLVLLSICGALGVANFVVFIIVRDKVFLVYTLTMVMAVVLGLAGRPGLGWELAWRHLSASALLLEQVFLIAYYVAIAIFSRTFLDLGHRKPRFDRLIFGALAVYTAIDIWLQWFMPLNGLSGAVERISSATDVCYFGIIWIVGAWVWRSGVRSARFFVFAFSGLLVGLIIDATGQGALGESSILFPFGGIAWEGTMLFAALADNYNLLERDRARADAERIEMVKQRSSEIEYLSLHDSLTGLPNRRSIEVELAQLAGDGGLTPTHALAYIDLDHFKVVNDTFGHTAGDQFLIDVAQCLRGIARPGDSVARIGGDEFLVLLRNVESMEAVSGRADELREAIALMHVMWEDQTIHPSASIGVALARPGAADPIVLMSLADAACAVAKDS